MQQQAVAVRERRAAEANAFVTPVAASTRNSFPVALCTTTSVLPSGVASMPFRLKPGDELEVAGQRERVRVRCGAPFFASATR